MKIEDVLNDLQASDLLTIVGPHWQESMASFPDGVPDFLRPEQIRTNLQWCGFEAEFEPALIGAAGKIAANRSLLCLAWHYYRMIFEYEAGKSPLRFVPLEKTLGDDAAIFYLLIALAIVPRMRTFHRRLGVPEQVTRDTCLQVKCYCDNYRRGHAGRLGICVEQIGWLNNYVNGSLFFRLGRFEYCSHPFPYEYKVYRHREKGRMIALAGPAWKINSSGLIEGIGADTEAGSGWQTTLKQIGADTCGFPINPKGFVEPNLVRLPGVEWECVLEKGVQVLVMHIPAGGGMSLEKCSESLQEARRFFREYFPSTAPRAIVTMSWMFSPILEQILPADSNLVKFMRELYLCPFNSRGPDSLWFVFLQRPLDLATAPDETSLQKAILNYLRAGKTWHDGSMFLMLDDIDRFGGQWYRASYSTGDLSCPPEHCQKCPKNNE